MPKTTTVITNLVSGEFSPRMEGRMDIPQYLNSCRKLENFLVRQQGGVDRRPGSVYVATAKTAAQSPRLEDLVIDNDNAFVLEFGENYIRFFKNGAIVGAPEEEVTTYQWEELFQLQFAQNPDGVLYIVHPLHAPATLTKGATDTDWTLANITFETVNVYQDFNAAGDYPSCVNFFKNQLILGATNNKPQTIWASNVGVYNDFGNESADTAWEKTYVGKGNYRIRWIEGKDDLLVGTDSGELLVTGYGAPLTKANGDGILQSGYGSKNIDAQFVGDVVLFVQKGGRKIREYGFIRDASTFRALDLTILSEHITKGGINQLALQTEPQTILWCVRDDGTLVGLTYDKQYQLVGWFRYITDGNIESIAVIPGTEEDQLWISVLRDTDTNRFIEYLKPYDWGTDDHDMFFVDSGITWDGGDATNIEGATAADPVVITATGYTLSTGDFIRIRNVGGMTELNTTNNGIFYVVEHDANTFSLRLEDGTTTVDGIAFTAFDSSITGDTTYGTDQITNVSATDIALLSVGMVITGTGIPSGTTITELSTDSFTISADTTANGTDVALTVMGTAEPVKKIITGLTHLNLETVSVLADGAPLPDEIVASNQVTIDEYANKVHVGQKYTSKLQPMRIGITSLKKISKIALRLYKTLTCKVGTTESNVDPIEFRAGSDLMDSALSPFTGDKEPVMSGGYTRSGDIMIIAEQPLPCNILSIEARIQDNEPI